MEGRRFDRITRVWGTCVDRREGVRQVVTVLIAFGAWGRTARAAAEDPIACGSDEDCTVGLDACTGAVCLKGTCRLFVADCLPGDVCCGNGSCCPDESPIACLADADCPIESDDPCHAVRCESGQCALVITDCAPETTCCGNGECCSVAEDGCASDADCVSPAGSCRQGRCLNGACVPGPASCPSGSICRDGVCIPIGSASI